MNYQVTLVSTVIAIGHFMTASVPSNLLGNPGFEDDLTGWTTTGNAAIRTGGPPPHEGEKYLFGDSTPHFTAAQDVALVAAGISTAEIDAGSTQALFGGWQSGWSTQTDQGQISILFLDGTWAELASSALPFFYSNHTWVEQSGRADLPPGTRYIRYHFEGVRHAGSNNDAYLDAAYLSVSTVLDRQPDLWIMQGSRWLGNDIYNADATDQTATGTIGSGQTRVYQARLCNDSSEVETFYIQGPGGDADWTVQYYRGTTVSLAREITSKVTSARGWRRGNVPAGGRRNFLMGIFAYPPEKVH